jgi:hypothetical protein
MSTMTNQHISLYILHWMEGLIGNALLRHSQTIVVLLDDYQLSTHSSLLHRDFPKKFSLCPALVSSKIQISPPS